MIRKGLALSYVAWGLFGIALTLFVFRVASTANISIVLVFLSIIIFAIGLKDNHNTANKIGLYGSIIFLIIVLLMYLFFLGMK